VILRPLIGRSVVLVNDSGSPERKTQLLELNNLVITHGIEKVLAHTFEWKRYPSASQKDEWLPMYDFQKVKMLADVWKEHVEGLNGKFSLQELDARWKRNRSTVKSEHSRRKKIIELIERLRSRPNWNLSLVWRFLDAEYPVPQEKGVRKELKTVRSFADYLQNKEGGAAEAIDAAASAFTH
jgi:hypothetical protein